MIKAKIISEVVGSPENHVNKTLDLLMEKIKERKDFVVSNEKRFEAEKMPDKPLYSGFWEYLIEFEKPESLVGFCFDFMPSSIEILGPLEINLKSVMAADLFNELLARLHQNELVLRNAMAQIMLLKREMTKR